MKSFRREQGEFYRIPGSLLHLLPLLFGEGLHDAPGNAEGGVDLPAAQHADDVHRLAPGLDHLRSDLDPDLVDHAEDVPLSHGCVGAHYEVGTAEDIEMDRVVRYVKGGVKKLPQLLRRRRRLDVEHLVRRLGCGEMVRLGQTPQMRGVMSVSSSTRLPWENFSKPLSSGMTI